MKAQKNKQDWPCQFLPYFFYESQIQSGLELLLPWQQEAYLSGNLNYLVSHFS